MRIPARGLLLPILLLAIPAAGAQGDKLRSPWDDRKIALTAVPYECPAPPPFAKTQEIGSYYIDNTHRSSTRKNLPLSKRLRRLQGT